MKTPKSKTARKGGSLERLVRRFRELADDLHRMAEDANHVRLSHLRPKNRREEKVRDDFAATANAYYMAERKLRLLIPPNVTMQATTSAANLAVIPFTPRHSEDHDDMDAAPENSSR